MVSIYHIRVLPNLCELHMNDWSLGLESGNLGDFIYLDLCKAFDCVPHRRLPSSYKLQSYGIAGKLVRRLD